MPRYLFANKVFVGKVLVAPVTPFPASPQVEILGEGLRQPIRQRLGHDRVVVVVVALEFLAEFRSPKTRANGESAQVIREWVVAIG